MSVSSSRLDETARSFLNQSRSGISADEADGFDDFDDFDAEVSFNEDNASHLPTHSQSLKANSRTGMFLSSSVKF